MNKSIKYLLFIILFWGCNANTGKQFDGYILTGKTSGINDNTATGVLTTHAFTAGGTPANYTVTLTR